MKIGKFQVIKSKRKTYSIQVKESGDVIVKVPAKSTYTNIFAFIKRHEKWITKKLKDSKRKRQTKKKYLENGEYLFLGRRYVLTLSKSQNKGVVLKNNRLYVKYDIKDRQAALTEYYIKHAREIISQRVDLYASKFGFIFNSIKITKAKKQWGSCSIKGNLHFSFRLVMAPVKIIDYVVVHELVHLKIMNHSKGFWLEVEKLLPDFKKRKAWLKENGYLLNL